MSALRAFGAPLDTLSEADLARPGIVFQMGVPPNRIDLMTSTDAVTFDEAWNDRISTSYGDQTIAVIGRVQLIANKRATGRAPRTSSTLTSWNAGRLQRRLLYSAFIAGGHLSWPRVRGRGIPGQTYFVRKD
jgi:hypothetical protein